MDTTTMFVIGETILVVGAVFSAYMKTKIQLATLEVQIAALAADHSKFEVRLEGISKNLAQITGQLKGINVA